MIIKAKTTPMFFLKKAWAKKPSKNFSIELLDFSNKGLVLSKYLFGC